MTSGLKNRVRVLCDTLRAVSYPFTGNDGA